MRIIDAVKMGTLSTIYRPFYKTPRVMNSEDTLQYIIDNRCSIARFGDGELGLMYGKGISFQSYNRELAKKLKEVKTNDKCLVCIPNIFGKNLCKDSLTAEDYSFWKRTLFAFGGLWKKSFTGEQLLGDSLISRFYLRYSDKTGVSDYIKKLKMLWQDRNIVFVEGKNSRLGYGNDLFDNAKSIRRIIAPEKNAFDKYDKILSAVKKHCNKSDLIIIALGPSASVLAYELSDEYQALDLGHVDIEYEWFRMGATKKVPVKDKHVNECNSMGDCSNENLQSSYLSEIIEII